MLFRSLIRGVGIGDEHRVARIEVERARDGVVRPGGRDGQDGHARHDAPAHGGMPSSTGERFKVAPWAYHLSNAGAALAADGSRTDADTVRRLRTWLEAFAIWSAPTR